MAVVCLSRVLFAEAQVKISDTWLLDLRTVCAVLGVVLFGTWHIARWMRKIDDTLKMGEDRFDRIENNMKSRDGVLEQIRNRVDKLPCNGCSHEKE